MRSLIKCNSDFDFLLSKKQTGAANCSTDVLARILETNMNINEYDDDDDDDDGWLLI